MAYTYTSYGGRGSNSPYHHASLADNNRSLSNNFEYIDPDHDMLYEHRPSMARLPVTTDDPEEPDMIHARYMGQRMSVKFPAYSISEETASVGQLRAALAEALDTEPRRIRLVYKKQELKNDTWPLRSYSLKQNSEVMVIKTDGYIDSDRESNVSSGSDGATTTKKSRRPRALSSVRDRMEDWQAQPKKDEASHFLDPRDNQRVRESRSLLHPGQTAERRPSRSRDASPHPQPLPTPSPSPMPSYPPADPNTPLGKVQGLHKAWSAEWRPLCQKFLANPPPDKKERQKEHRKLSESVMTHILLKADAIDVDGDDTRKFRKGLLNEVNETLKKMDAI